MKKIHEKGKLDVLADNKGFTLIEVLVAMTVLVIVAIPILNTFSSSAKININYKAKQRQTTLAQNITEGIKSVSLDEIKTQFTGTSANFSLLNGYNSDISVAQCAKTDDKYIFGLQNSGNDISYFAISNIKSGSKTYDALIKLEKIIDVNSIHDSISTTLKDTTSIVDISSSKVVVMDSSGLLNNADYINQAINKFSEKYEADGIAISDAEIAESLKVEMDVDINVDSSGGSDVYKIFNYMKYSTEDYLDDDAIVLPEHSIPIYASETYPDFLYMLLSPASTRLNYINFGNLPRKDDSNNDIFTNIMIFSKTTTTGKGRFRLNFNDGSDVDFMKQNVKIYCNCGWSYPNPDAAALPLTPRITKQDIFTNVDSDFGRRGINVRESTSSTSRIYKMNVEIYEHHDDEDDRFSGTAVTSLSSSFYE